MSYAEQDETLSTESLSHVCLWLGAALDGRAAPDDLLDRLGEVALSHVCDGEPLGMRLGGWRSAGATGTSLALPVPGDLCGLAGPAELNEEALEAGGAVLLVGASLGLVPRVVGAAVEWRSLPCLTPPPLDPGEAGTQLRVTLSRTVEELVRLRVSTWAPDIADELHDLRSREPAHLPPGVPVRLAQTIDRAHLCLHIVELARQTESGALSVHEIERRREALAPLESAARHALVAACRR